MELLLKILGGGITGYITNSLAVKMLFRGIIVRTRLDFIQNLSLMVERDIINKESLADGIKREKLKPVFMKIVYDTFSGFSQNKVIKDIVESININYYTQKIKKVLVEPIIDLISFKTYLSSFLGNYYSENREKISKYFKENILLIKNRLLTFTSTKNGQELIEELENTFSSEYFNPDFLLKVDGNLQDLVFKLNNFLASNQNEINQMLQETISESLSGQSTVKRIIYDIFLTTENLNRFIKIPTGIAAGKIITNLNFRKIIAGISVNKQKIDADKINKGGHNNKKNTGIKSLLSYINYKYDYFQNKTIELLEGRISEIVYQKLIELEEGDLKKLLENFMGRELKPISYLGALIGSILALIIFIFTGSIEYSLFLAIITYGFAGFITNVIALKMIFRPYSRKHLLGLKIPFTPGIIAREQSRFADSLGKIIKKELLSDKLITSTVQLKREEINTGIKRVINEYSENISGEELYLILKNNQESIINFTIQNIDKFINNKFVREGLAEVYLNDLISYRNKEKIINLINENFYLLKNINSTEQSGDFLYSLLNKEQLKTYVIEEAGPVYSLSNRFLNFDETVDKIIEKIINERLPLFIDKHSDELNKILNDFMDDIFDTSVSPLDMKAVDLLDIFCNIDIDSLLEIFFRGTEDNLLKNMIDSIYFRTEINKIIEDDEFTNQFINNLDSLLKEFREEIDADNRNIIIETAAESLTIGIEKNMPELLSKLGLDKITRDKVKEMNPGEIEKLFYSVAGHYFLRLELYGWAGGILGLIMELTLRFVK